MHIKRIISLCGLFWVFCAGSAPCVDLRIMVPLYVYPTKSKITSVWNAVRDAGSKVPVTAIVNAGNGPNGGPPDASYVLGLQALRDGGVTILGYVYSGYGTRDIAAVKADIDIYDASWNINGIFIDEADNTTNHLAYYTDLYAYIKSRANLNAVVINPGINTVEGYISTPACDTAVIFEIDQGWPAYVPPAYVTNYPPERFCALPYNVINEATMRQYVDIAVQRNIGYIYVTNDKGSNPWDTIPSYWTNLVNYVETYRNLSIAMPGAGELQLRTLPLTFMAGAVHLQFAEWNLASAH